MKQVIGFASQFYTLWDYEIETTYVTNSYGNHFPSGQVTKFYYRKNISTDINKVKEIYPNLSIDPELRGKTASWEKSENIELPEGFFWFGKNFGKSIDDVLKSDMGYCEWVVSERAFSKEATYIKSNQVYIDHVTEVQAKEKALIHQSGFLSVGQEVELTFTSNGFNYDEEHGYCYAKCEYGDTEVWVKISECRKVLGMYPYIMPNIGGKCQKTKNKTFKVAIKEAFEPRIEKFYGETKVRQVVAI